MDRNEIFVNRHTHDSSQGIPAGEADPMDGVGKNTWSHDVDPTITWGDGGPTGPMTKREIYEINREMSERDLR